jgi:hypothetical protein
MSNNHTPVDHSAGIVPGKRAYLRRSPFQLDPAEDHFRLATAFRPARNPGVGHTMLVAWGPKERSLICGERLNGS